jgi:hypothetical protein
MDLVASIAALVAMASLMTFVVLGGIYFIYLHRLLRHLRMHHRDWWESLGSPAPALFPVSISVSRETVRFIRERQYERIGEATIIALGERARHSLARAFVCFCAMMSAFFVMVVFGASASKGL